MDQSNPQREIIKFKLKKMEELVISYKLNLLTIKDIKILIYFKKEYYEKHKLDENYYDKIRCSLLFEEQILNNIRENRSKFKKYANMLQKAELKNVLEIYKRVFATYDEAIEYATNYGFQNLTADILDELQFFNAIQIANQGKKYSEWKGFDLLTDMIKYNNYEKETQDYIVLNLYIIFWNKPDENTKKEYVREVLISPLTKGYYKGNKEEFLGNLKDYILGFRVIKEFRQKELGNKKKLILDEIIQEEYDNIDKYLDKQDPERVSKKRIKNIKEVITKIITFMKKLMSKVMSKEVYMPLFLFISFIGYSGLNPFYLKFIKK